MSSVYENLEIARLYHQQADFAKAKAAALASLSESLDSRDKKDWNEAHYIESLRLAAQCSLELDDLVSLNPLVDHAIHLFERPAVSQSVESMRWHFLALWSLFHSETDQAFSLLEKSLDAATKAKDNQMIARSLHAQAVLNCYDSSQFSKALEILEKVILIATAIKLPEIVISAKILRSHIFFSLQNFGLASDILWEVYSTTQQLGYHHLTANIVFQLSKIQSELGNDESAATFNELAMRSITAERYPRLYRLTKESFQTSKAETKNWDLIIDEDDHVIFERTKGLINFRNQHTLFDLIFILAKNQGTRFTKEDLIQRVWNQKYESEIHDNVIYVTIKRLRLLIEPSIETPKYILRDRAGYYISNKISIDIKSNKESTHVQT